MVIEKLTTSLKNKNWTNPQLKTIETAMTSDKTRLDTIIQNFKFVFIVLYLNS